MRKYL